MKALERYRLTCKILASILIASQGLYYSLVQPGPMDLINGVILGLILYVIWFNKDRELN